MRRESKETAKRENLVLLASLLGGSADAPLAMQDIARRLHRAYERQCNENMDERTEKRLEARIEKDYFLAAGIASRYSLHIYHNTAPRGWPILLSRQPITRDALATSFRVCPY